MRLKTMKLRTRIIVTVAVLIALLAGSSGIAIFQLANLGREIEVFVNGYIPLQREAQAIRRLAMEQTMLAEEAITQEGDFDEALAVSDEVNTRIGELRRIVEAHDFADQAETIDDMRGTIEERYRIFEEEVETAAGDVSTADGGFIAAQRRFSDAVASRIDRLEVLASERAQDLNLRRIALSGFLGITLVVALIVGIGASFLLIRSVQRQLGADPEIVRSIAHRISQGKLTDMEDAAAGKNGTRGLLLSLRQMEHGLYEVIEQIQESVRNTGRQNRELASASSQTAASTEEIAATVTSFRKLAESLVQSISEISSAVDEIRANIDGLNQQASNQATAVHQTSSSVEQINASLQNVAETTKLRRKATEQLTETISGGREMMGKTALAIEELARNSEAIKEVTAIINDISAQTNLLSMNAAIEAAHAGDQGKGFAVVAEEIRKLAEDSAQNSQKISDILNKNNTLVQQLKETSTETETVYTDVEENARETLGSFQEIADTMDELAAGAGEITEAVTVLNETSVTVQGGSKEIKEGVELIQQSTSRVNENATEVGQAVTEISTGVSEINDAMIALNESVNKIADSMGELEQEISGFELDAQIDREIEEQAG